MPEAKRTLVLCTGNSCRSQMMHGFLKHFGGDAWQVSSAGLETHGLNPRAVKVMAEDGIDIAHHRSVHIDEYRGDSFAHVITVCDHARETCPWFPANAEMIHQSFNDPARAKGTEEEILDAFRKVRDEIKAFAKKFVEERSS